MSDNKVGNGGQRDAVDTTPAQPSEAFRKKFEEFANEHFAKAHIAPSSKTASRTKTEIMVEVLTLIAFVLFSVFVLLYVE